MFEGVRTMEVPRHWRLRKQRYTLVGSVCAHCTAKIFPPRDVCPHCGSKANYTTAYPLRDSVYTFPAMSRIDVEQRSVRCA